MVRAWNKSQVHGPDLGSVVSLLAIVPELVFLFQAYLHAMCIIHRDLNSHNCLIKLVRPTSLDLPRASPPDFLVQKRLAISSCFRPEIPPRAPVLPFLLRPVPSSVF